MRLTVVTIAVAAIAVCSSVTADEVIMKNGENLVGTVQSLDEGTLTVKSESAGTVTVDIKNVATFSTDTPVELHFMDGTVSKQQVSADEDGRIRTEGTDVLRSQSFAIVDLVAVNPPPEPKPDWKGTVTAGYTVTRGNSKTSTANIAADLLRRSEIDRITLKGSYIFGRQEDPDTGEDETTTDKWHTAVKYDYFVAEKWYAFADTRVERNRIADLDLRLTTGTGGGRQWIETDRLNFDTEAGLAWLYENYSADDEDEDGSTDEISAYIGYHFKASANDQVALLHELKYYPSLEQISDYYLTTEAELRADLTKSLFASFKVVVDFDATPAADARHTDASYILGLGIRLL